MRNLYEQYQEILCTNKYNYYSLCDWKQPVCNLFLENNKNFVSNIIAEGGKATPKIQELIGNLDDNRCCHIISTYFFGLCLYSIPTIKITINKQLHLLPICENNVEDDNHFSYIWFLICFFHDLGYAYENGLLEIELNKKMPHLYRFKYSMLPSIYTDELVGDYKKFRLKCMNTRDHGIYGSMSVYNEILSQQAKYQNTILNSGNIIISWKKCLIKAFRTMSNIIMVHNIFYKSKDDIGAKCYKYHHLETLLYDKFQLARYIKFKEHPLLFLFCLVDSIEPIKRLKDIEKLKFIELEERNGTLLFNLTHDVIDEYGKQLWAVNEWLTDVEKKETNKYEIRLF